MGNRLHNSNFTMEDIALELGLSKSTVSRALSDSGRISVGTKERVKTCAKKHGFKPNLVAKALAGKRTLNIAAIMPLEASASQMMFFHECLSGIVSRASKEGYSTLVCMNEKDNSSILESILSNGKVDAAVVTQLMHDDKTVELLKKYHLPFVVIGSGAGKDIVYVDSRMKENCAQFTRICLNNLPQNSNVLFVCGSLDVEANNNRLSGFLSGIEKFPSLQYEVCKEDDDIEKRLSQESWKMILCSDDVICMKVDKILKLQNRSIGKDVLLASFHDSILLESHSPGISALRVDALSLGSVAAELSIKMLSGTNYETVNYVDCSFQMRQSTC